MLCPYCQTAFVEERETVRESTCPKQDDSNDGYTVRMIFCPQCIRLIVVLQEGTYQAFHEFDYLRDERIWDIKNEAIIYPPLSYRYQIPEEVPPLYHSDFREADMLLDISPNASAALSRRCLQSILNNHFEIKKEDLFKEIQEYLDTIRPPSQIANLIDAIRHIGNMSAHAWKNRVTDEIIDVEPEEAELSLSVLHQMFDFHFVQPQRVGKVIEQINAKRQAAGKKPIDTQYE